VAVHARPQSVAVLRVEVVEEDHRVLHLVGVGIDDAEAVVHGRVILASSREGQYDGTMDTKAAARERIDGARDALVDLSHRIHAHPEPGFEEERSAAWTAELPDAAGFPVHGGVGDLPTAFAARGGSAPRHVPT